MPHKEPYFPMKPQKHNEDQSRLFIEAAREVGADEKRSAADALMGKLAHIPPDPKPKPRPKAGKIARAKAPDAVAKRRT